MDRKGSSYFSIIVPTYHEAKNLPELIKRIAQIDFGQRVFEVILVDDNSQDGTYEVVNHWLTQYPWLRLMVRKEKKGLSESVVDGLKWAKYPLCIIMDADLSHPPEKIPEILAALEESEVDLVIGSRYIKGGSSDEMWPIARKILSRLAALAARVLVAVPVKDPLSGFLALRKDAFFSGIQLEPVSWKIGLEIMVKCHYKNIKEVPIHFSQRVQGKSKLNFKVAMNYLRHVNQLIWFKVFSTDRK
jgi:dolichol-phosphate mannosyltransferase